MTIPQQGFPGTPTAPIADTETGDVTPIWFAFFVNLWQRTGGSTGTITYVLDNISDVPGATLYRDSTEWTGLLPAPQGEVYQMGAAFPEWGLLGGANFPDQLPNTLFAGPASGVSVAPSFRTLVTADLTSVAGAIPGAKTNSDASAGNVGEYIFQQVASGAAVGLTTTDVADVASIALTAGDWDVWALIAFSALPTSNARAWINSTSATDPGAPNNGAYLSVGNQTVAAPVGMERVSLNAPATLYLSTVATFTGSLSAFGFLGARRAR
jgi:hypothetical protein